MCAYLLFAVNGGMLDLIVLVLVHCCSFYMPFTYQFGFDHRSNAFSVFYSVASSIRLLAFLFFATFVLNESNRTENEKQIKLTICFILYSCV